MIHLGNVPASTTVYVPFTTYAGSTGASITCTGLAVTDIEIYKNGSTTQRASDAGIALLDTDGIDFDGITGLHGFSIDLSDNTDSGFYTVGSWYWVVVSAITVDSQTVTFLAAIFRIAPTETLTGYPKTDDVGRNIITGVADAGSTTTTIELKSSEITPTVTNQWKGRIIIFDKDTATANLRGQGAPIDGNSTTQISIAAGDALTTAPAEDDTFKIF